MKQIALEDIATVFASEFVKQTTILDYEYDKLKDGKNAFTAMNSRTPTGQRTGGTP